MGTIENMVAERFGSKLDDWKKQYAPRSLSVIEVDGKMAVLRPVMACDVANYTMMVAGDAGLDGAGRYLLEELWLGGDNELRDDEEYFIGAMLQVQNVIELKKALLRSCKARL